jgi:cytochrome P450
MPTIFDSEFAARPWPILDRLRADGGVHRVATPDGPPAWLITRYDDVRAVLLDPRRTTRIHDAGGADYPHLGLGHGAHACLGQALVRTVTLDVLHALFGRWPATELVDADPRWRSGFRHRGPMSVRIRLR